MISATGKKFLLPWRPKFKEITLFYIQSLQSGNYAKASRETNVGAQTLIFQLGRVLKYYYLHHNIKREEVDNFKLFLRENFSQIIEYIKLHLVDEESKHLIDPDDVFFNTRDIANLYEGDVCNFDDVKNIENIYKTQLNWRFRLNPTTEYRAKELLNRYENLEPGYTSPYLTQYN